VVLVSELFLGLILVSIKDRVQAFLGIPFAQQAGRFEAAVPVQLNGTVVANAYGPACPQGTSALNSWLLPFPKNQTFSEDCLSINVFVPSSGSTSAVLVWIYGGAYSYGGSSQTTYSGYNLARRSNSIVVTFNYRVGPFGFLALEALMSQEEQNGAFGFGDQQMALKWVQKNIGAFGGSSQNVTIFGESAGAASVMFHLTSPSSFPLYQKAIIESGSNLGVPMQIANQEGLALLQAANCSTVACLKEISAKELLQAFESMPGTHFSHAAFGGIIPLPPQVALEHGAFNYVPLIFGNVLNESNFEIFGAISSPVPPQDYSYALGAILKSVLRSYSSLSVVELMKLYPCTEGDCRYVLSELLGDASLVCPTTLFGEAYAAFRNKTAVFGYLFEHRSSWVRAPSDWGVYHTIELDYVFDQTETMANVSTSEVLLGEEMAGWWSNFAKTGSPQEDTWKPYGEAFERYNIQPVPRGMVGWRRDVCNSFWKGVYLANAHGPNENIAKL
jgi:carboxylesterase type B